MFVTERAVSGIPTGVEFVSQPPRRQILGSGFHRDVAQPGSALAWGARGREFKSRRPDQFLIEQKPVHAQFRNEYSASDSNEYFVLGLDCITRSCDRGLDRLGKSSA
jgi:hypothetical protein